MRTFKTKPTGRPRETNAHWIVGPVALIDVSTPKHPRAIALVNAADLLFVLDGGGRWGARRERPGLTLYAHRYCSGSTKAMHHQLLNLDVGRVGDHRNGDGLDNRRLNLRAATRAQNARNRRDHASSSRFKGVGWSEAARKWKAQIGVDNRRIYIGVYSTEETAARAYDAAAREHFGEFARLNFPHEPAAPAA